MPSRSRVASVRPCGPIPSSLVVEPSSMPAVPNASRRIEPTGARPTSTLRWLVFAGVLVPGITNDVETGDTRSTRSPALTPAHARGGSLKIATRVGPNKSPTLRYWSVTRPPSTSRPNGGEIAGTFRMLSGVIVPGGAGGSWGVGLPTQLGGEHTLGIEGTVGVSAVVVLPLLVPGNGVGIDGGGGAAGKTSDVMGSVPEVNVATVAPMAAFLAAVLPPSTGWVPVGDRPARALARICGVMGPEFRPMPVAVAKVLGSRLRDWLPTVRTRAPAKAKTLVVTPA